MPRVTLIQFTPAGGLSRNLKTMEEHLAAAAKEKPDLVAFPEMACCLGDKESKRQAVADHSALLARFGGWAKKFGVDLLPGSIPEPAPDGARHFNSSPYFGKDGKLLATYRKIHLFRATLPDRSYDEGKELVAGKEVVVVDRPWGKVGLAICFDIRFPELFRALRKRGATIVLLPAAFTVPTGKAHWDCLLRARAIENGCFVAAPATTGKHDDGRETYGNSAFITPWGDICSRLDHKEGPLTCDLDVAELTKAEGLVPSWSCRREDVFPVG